MHEPAFLNAYDNQGLVKHILNQFRISRQGVHGPAHWARVHHHGQTIGTVRQADLLVVELFAFLHDSQRVNEYTDRDHGNRASEFAASLNGVFYDLNARQLDQLCNAIRWHSDGSIEQDATIQTCWDADRLDLGRVGIYPDPRFLSAEASTFIQSAYEWSTTIMSDISAD
jgi:uncharacterized protein